MSQKTHDTNRQMQTKILEGLLKQYPAIKPPKDYVAWEDDPMNPNLDERKTLAMRLVESHFGRPIEVLLSMDKKGVDIAKYLTISPSTVNNWRLRLGLTKPTRERIRNGHDYGSK